MEVRSPVTGSLWKLLVKDGQEVSDGEELLILESMKMEFPVEAEADGTVRGIKCEEGQGVSEDELLLTIDEES